MTLEKLIEVRRAGKRWAVFICGRSLASRCQWANGAEDVRQGILHDIGQVIEDAKLRDLAKLTDALERSVRLQSEYAALLNFETQRKVDYPIFATAADWMAHLEQAKEQKG